MQTRETIIAVATASGRGAVGIVRASGPDLSALASALIALDGAQIRARHAYLQVIRDAQGQPIDEAILLYFAQPQSYTGEDVLELQTHGGPVVMQLVQARLMELARGLGLAIRLARPGEFTERAFLNDKIDLAQAEAIADLINASSEQAAKSASRSLQGAFSLQINQFAKELIALRVLVEACIDFPEEEIEHIQNAAVVKRLAVLGVEVNRALAQSEQGAILRDGLRVVIAGQPNAGKSALLNALAGAELAIVSSVAGTTRDKIEQSIHIHGVPLHIIDTAGLRASQDEVEQIGIARAWDAIDAADMVLFVHDASRVHLAEYRAADAEIAARLPSGVARLELLSKVDLVDALEKVETPTASKADAIAISSKTGLGLEDLRSAILKQAGWSNQGEGLIMARQRHVHALRDAQEHIGRAQSYLAHPAPPLELIAEELRLTQEALNSITGEFGADDLLGEIFSNFCIGK